MDQDQEIREEEQLLQDERNQEIIPDVEYHQVPDQSRIAVEKTVCLCATKRYQSAELDL